MARLDLEDKTIVSEEHKGRDNRWNLFCTDRRVAIPIIIDAFKVIELIGGKIFQKKYVFSSTYTLSAGKETYLQQAYLGLLNRPSRQ